MKKFNVFMTIKGPGGSVTAPAKQNPIEAESLPELLRMLAENLPYQVENHLGLSITGLSVREEDSEIKALLSGEVT
jgi:hypothetical protein